MAIQNAQTTVYSPGLGADPGAPTGRLSDLMQRRTQEILLVATPYDSYILEEDGLLGELIVSEYIELGLSNAPRVTRVARGEEALAAVREKNFDLVISMRRLRDTDISSLAPALRRERPDLQIVLLLPNETELSQLRPEDRARLGVDRIYVWGGDAKLFLAIIKEMEDRWNVDHDTQVGGVGVIILIEDSVRYRSSLLPLMYSELVNQTRSVMLDGLNHMQKLLRLRARPKILVAEDYEGGERILRKYRDYLFGVVCDVSFPHRGRHDHNAGIEFICQLQQEAPDIPALLNSSDLANREKAEAIGVSFLHKRSATLLQDLRRFMLNNFGFGDFVFRLPDRTEVGRASDMYSMHPALREAPIESIEYHARRNHFSNWLRARSEFRLAARLRPRKASDFRDSEALRSFLIDEFRDALRDNRRGVVEDFRRDRFETGSCFSRLGGGSIGGKARGLAFLDTLLMRSGLDRAFDDVRVFVPNSVCIGADVFDQFIETNRLRGALVFSSTDQWIRASFLRARLPEWFVADLRHYLDVIRTPIAVRSSSLLEDSQHNPFAGVYDTCMVPNNASSDAERLRQLCDAIKLVYASTFVSAARRYLEATGLRAEEQKMAVILQPICGSRREHYFYPNVAGVVRSYNFYPFGHMRPEDGVAIVALGLGKTVVEGGEALRFCPAHPRSLPQVADAKQFLDHSQRGFFAVDLNTPADAPIEPDAAVKRLTLTDAERHGTLDLLGSVWDHESQAFHDGIHRPGVRVVSFAHLLKNEAFPLAQILQRLLELGNDGMSGPVEMEFACNLDARPREFAVLQIRPYGGEGQFDAVDIDSAPSDQRLVYSRQALGHGVLRDLRHVVYVRRDRFDPARTREIARELANLNETLRSEEKPYLLIGPGRWGSSNSWLGIPVTWAQISSARVIVETALDDFVVDPSQGSHFFHNLTAAGVSYLTVHPQHGGGWIDWEWLEGLPAVHESEMVRLIELPEPLEVRLDGRGSGGVVLKRALPQRIGSGA